MKNFLKENWFKLIIIIVSVSSLIFAYILHSNKQERYLNCVNKAQIERSEQRNEVTSAWVSSKVTRDFADQGYRDIASMYDDEIKDCLLIK